METDVAIIGAGPAGLCFARALAESGLSIVLVERLKAPELAHPAFDGREIALTHRSVSLLKQLGVWGHLPENEISPLRNAKVLNGRSPRAMHIDNSVGGRNVLGYLVPNHRIREAAYASVGDASAITLLDGARMTQVRTSSRGIEVDLADGRNLSTRLLVAADSRFSEARRCVGIPVRMYDFGKSMLVCRMSHEVPHHQTAWEWFGIGQTLALLPLQDVGAGVHQSSVVLTLPSSRMGEIQVLDDAAFAREMERRFHGRLGRMQLVGTRHAYPLVGTYPKRFVAERFALIGDAAVGMHPVTAHGFNFGLLSVERLANEIRRAQDTSGDIGGADLLERYDRGHRRATLPLYLATRGLVGLFTDDRWPARMLRSAALRAAGGFAPTRRLLSSWLADEDGPAGHLRTERH